MTYTWQKSSVILFCSVNNNDHKHISTIQEELTTKNSVPQGHCKYKSIPNIPKNVPMLFFPPATHSHTHTQRTSYAYVSFMSSKKHRVLLSYQVEPNFSAYVVERGFSHLLYKGNFSKLWRVIFYSERATWQDMLNDVFVRTWKKSTVKKTHFHFMHLKNIMRGHVPLIQPAHTPSGRIFTYSVFNDVREIWHLAGTKPKTHL